MGEILGGARLRNFLTPRLPVPSCLMDQAGPHFRIALRISGSAHT